MSEYEGGPVCRVMARAAVQARYKVAAGLAGRRYAVMTGRAGTGNPGVRKVGRRPGGGAVTSTALRRRGDVGGRLAGSDRAVMTRRTGAYYCSMVDLGDRIPCASRMTGIATVAGGDMGRGFAGGGGAVMASKAGAADRRVGKVGRHPGRGAVASIALRRGDDVSHRLAGGDCSVMT